MGSYRFIPLLLLISSAISVYASPLFSETSFVNPFLTRKDGEGKQHTKNTLQKEILDIFGVDHRPRPNLFYRDNSKEMSATKYMIDLYNSVTTNGVVSDNDDDDIVLTNTTTNDTNAVKADTVVSFVNHGKLIIMVQIYHILRLTSIFLYYLSRRRYFRSFLCGTSSKHYALSVKLKFFKSCFGFLIDTSTNFFKKPLENVFTL